MYSQGEKNRAGCKVNTQEGMQEYLQITSFSDVKIGKKKEGQTRIAKILVMEAISKLKDGINADNYFYTELMRLEKILGDLDFSPANIRKLLAFLATIGTDNDELGALFGKILQQAQANKGNIDIPDKFEALLKAVRLFFSCLSFNVGNAGFVQRAFFKAVSIDRSEKIAVLDGYQNTLVAIHDALIYVSSLNSPRP